MLKGLVLILVCAFIVMLAWSDVSTTSASASAALETSLLLQERTGVLGGPQCLVPDENRPGLDRVTGEKFERRLRISKVEGDQVWIRYALENVTCTGYYVVHFWPNGRHSRPLAVRNRCARGRRRTVRRVRPLSGCRAGAGIRVRARPGHLYERGICHISRADDHAGRVDEFHWPM